MQQLVDSNFFVPAEVNIQNCYSDEELSDKYIFRFTEQIQPNLTEDSYLASQEYRMIQKDSDKDEGEVKDEQEEQVNSYFIPTTFGGLFRTYSE